MNVNTISKLQEPLYPSLPLPPAGTPQRRLKICIVSYDFVGPVRNGGVGTAFTSLGQALARAGHEVAFFYVSGNFCENKTLDHWIAHYRKEGIRFVPMPEKNEIKLAASFHMAKSFEAYQWLSREQFDVIHFSEWRAPGYYSIVAKKQGLAFKSTTLCIHTHGPTLWSLLSNGEYLSQVTDVELDFMERASVKLADVVVCPSHYLVGWMKSQDWEFSENTFVQQYVQPANARRKTSPSARQLHEVCELVFFGRIEIRKGLVLFCDALDRLVEETDAHKLQITFLGKLTVVNGENGMQYLKSRAQKWPWKWQVISNLDQMGALDYLQGAGRLALIPSLVDNLPNTVLECLGGGVPFLASNIGGIPEMIAPEDHAEVLFPLRPTALAEKILHAARNGIRPSRFATEPETTERAWLGWHAGQDNAPFDFSLSPSLLDALPLVSVCMSHFNRPDMLAQAIDSLRAQDYQNFEVVLVDDASTKPEAIAYIDSLEAEFKERRWQLVRNSEELFVGAARNVAARHARGEYLMFMDDDNIAKPHEISSFVAVAQKTQADIVSCCLDFFSTKEPPRPDQLPDQRFLFLGPAISASALRNYLGDTNSLFRREVFFKLGGFHEERGVGHEDWELIADAILKGFHHEAIPDALVWYRRLNSGNSATAMNSLQRGHLRNIRPYLDAVPPSLRTLILFAQGQVIASPQIAAADNSRQIDYLKKSMRWRSLYEAARELNASRQTGGLKLLKAALVAAQGTDHPIVILESLLTVGAEMCAMRADDAQQVLQLAMRLARMLKRRADEEHAANLLAAHGKAKKSASFKTENAADLEPEVSIIIPVFNNLDFTRRCLESLYSTSAQTRHEIIVVDNGSTDGTDEHLKQQGELGRLRLVSSMKNVGFAQGCNFGAQAAHGKSLLFLNNDTQVTNGWLDALVAALRASDIGVVGAKLLYPKGTIQHAGIEFINGIPDHLHRNAPANLPAANQPREFDMVTGACLLTPRDLFLKLGGFDESFCNGVEDVDYCLRVRASGRKVIYEPKCVVYHHEGQSAGRFNHVKRNLEIFFGRWAKLLNRTGRLIVPTPPKIVTAGRSILLTNIPSTTPAAEVQEVKSVVISWEGSFLNHESLSHVNRELSSALKTLPDFQINCVNNGAKPSPDFENLAREISATPSPNATITVRHSWPPNWNRPRHGKLVVIQPWEFGALPEAWVRQARDVDEFWVPTHFVRNCYIESGVPAGKIFVVPNGVDADKFQPQAAPMKLATQKKFKFLFVGGTIGRKGPDLLLTAYLKNFTAADDVCLVIKDFGGNSVYTGQTFESQIRTAQSLPNAPEILYLNDELPPESLPGLYTACDCLVHPYRGEGFGLPVLEAMACGLPVIATAGGATDDFVRDEFAWRIPAERKIFGCEVSGMKLAGDGWLLEPNVAVLGEFMRRAFANPDETSERGKRASAHARQFCSWKNSAAMVAERIRKLTHGADKVNLPACRDTRQHVSPQPPVALVGQLNKARELFGQKNFPAAWEAALAAISKRPFHPEAFLLLAEIALAAGDSTSARRCAQRARDFAPDWNPPKQFLKTPFKGVAKLNWLRLPEENPKHLSVCLIVKNEEQFLAQCLKSVHGFARQIVVVDTGSTDRTIEIAKEFGAEVHSFNWCDDFAAARNVALEQATGDWILMLDADEELPADQHTKLLDDMKKSEVMAFRLPLVNRGQEAEGHSFVPRLFRNVPGAYYVGRIHEQVFPSLLPFCKTWGMKTARGTAEILHHGYSKETVRDRNKIERNLKLLRQAVEENPNDANLLMNFGLELVRSDNLTDGLAKYREAFDAMSAQATGGVVAELREALLTQFTSHLYKIRAHEEVVRVLTSPLAKNAGLTASLHFALGLSQFELKNYHGAAEQMRQCLAKRRQSALSPINTDILTSAPNHCLALALAKAGDAAGAEKTFQAALTENGRVEDAKLDYAKFLADQNRQVEAFYKLKEIVLANSRNVAAWRLGGQIALSRSEFLEFARDWTGEAMRYIAEDLFVTAQRAEALMLSGDTAGASELWERIWSSERKPRYLAALILCEAIESPTTHAADEGEEELAASRAFIEWYQKLIAMRMKSMVESINGQTDKLSRALPTAARLLETALAETQACAPA